MTDPPTIVVNAGAGSAARLLEHLRAAAEQGRCRLEETDDPRETLAALTGAAEAGVRRVVICGGDGTIRLALNTLRPYLDRVELGIVRGGTGNDFARSLDLPDDPAAAIETALTGPAAAVDLIGVDDDPPLVANCIAAGIGVRRSEDDGASKRLLGPVAYWTAALSDIASPPRYELSIEADGGTFEVAAHGFAVANGETVGGGFPIDPGALLDDGRLDLLVLPLQPVSQTLADAIEALTQPDELPENVVRVTCAACHVRAHEPMPMSLDGEISERPSIRVEVLPRAARIVVGKSPRLREVVAGAKAS